VCEQVGRAWFDRMKTQVDLRSELVTKSSATRWAPEVLQIHQKYLAQRMQAAAEMGSIYLTKVKRSRINSLSYCPMVGRHHVPKTALRYG